MWPQVMFWMWALTWIFAAQGSWAEVIRVRIHQTSSALEFSGVNLRFTHESGIKRVGFTAKDQFRIQRVAPQRGLARWKVVDLSSGEVKQVFREQIEVQGDTVSLGLKPLPQRVRLVSSGAKVSVLADIDLEDYLGGVLPSEMPASWPLEALKAQVVASRSYAFALRAERAHRNFDVEDSVRDQVFKPNAFQSLPSGLQSKVLQAVRETKDEVLWNSHEQIAKVFYHADCGGQTERASQVWGAGPSANSPQGRSQSCAHPSQTKWSAGLSREALEKKMRKHFSLSPQSKLADVSIVGRTPSGRVHELVTVFTNETPKKISGQKLRELVGFHLMKSTSFHLHREGDEFVFSGRGFGHGVGLCQRGAKHLAEEGKSYREILKKYFPSGEIRSYKRIQASL